MNRKAKGTRNEHRSIKLLEAAGYSCTRAAASLGLWDIVAVSPTDVVLLQVKTRDWPSSTEMAALHAFQAPPGVLKLVHRWRDRQRRPDVRVLPASTPGILNPERTRNAAPGAHNMNLCPCPVPA